MSIITKINTSASSRNKGISKIIGHTCAAIALIIGIAEIISGSIITSSIIHVVLGAIAIIAIIGIWITWIRGPVGGD